MQLYLFLRHIRFKILNRIRNAEKIRGLTLRKGVGEARAGPNRPPERMSAWRRPRYSWPKKITDRVGEEPGQSVKGENGI